MVQKKIISLIFVAVTGLSFASVAYDKDGMKENKDQACHDLFIRYLNRCNEKIATLPARQNRAPGDETTKSRLGYIRKYQNKYEVQCDTLLREGPKPHSNKTPYTNKWKFN